MEPDPSNQGSPSNIPARSGSSSSADPASGTIPPEPRSAPVPRPSDADLVERARSGDKDAFGLLVRRHQARLHRLVLHVVRSAPIAEELTQEVFVRAYRALPQFDGRSEPFTWLYRIALNLSLNERRRAQHRYETSADPRLPEPSSDSATPAEHAQRRELYQALMQGLDTLSELLRTTLLLVTIEGLSHDQAGEVLGVPAGTIAWRVHEARKKLAAHMASKGHGRATVQGGEP